MYWLIAHNSGVSLCLLLFVCGCCCLRIAYFNLGSSSQRIDWSESLRDRAGWFWVSDVLVFRLSPSAAIMAGMHGLNEGETRLSDSNPEAGLLYLCFIGSIVPVALLWRVLLSMVISYFIII